MKKQHQKAFLKNTKTLVAIIFALGFIFGALVSPYLNKSLIGASIFTDPSYDPISAACVRYNSTDESTVPPTPHRYECWETLVINESEYGSYPDTMWQCYSDGAPLLGWYVPYADHGGECANVP